MGRIYLDAEGVSAVGGILRDLGDGGLGVPASIRGHATSLASTVGPRMKRHDLAKVSILLMQASNDHRVPMAQRHTARFWGAYLDQCL
jgi:hypothetical protein